MALDPRRNFWLRTVASVTGDVAIGAALSSTCLWVIQRAALGLFLSFLLWIVTLLRTPRVVGVNYPDRRVAKVIVANHPCQYDMLHPVVALALSDAKLDQGMAVLASLAEATSEIAKYGPVWRHVRRGICEGTITSHR